MAQITITIPDGVAARVNDGIAGQYGYQAMIGTPPVANPETKTQFSKRMVSNFIKDTVKAFEASQAANTARQAAAADVETDIVLT